MPAPSLHPCLQATNTDPATGRPIVTAQALADPGAANSRWQVVQNAAAREREAGGRVAAATDAHADQAPALLVPAVSPLLPLHLVPNRGAEAMAYLQVCVGGWRVGECGGGASRPRPAIWCMHATLMQGRRCCCFVSPYQCMVAPVSMLEHQWAQMVVAPV